MPSPKTIVECPSEKKNPMESGRLPSAISLRVVLSIAEMWSASKAWRMPEGVGGDRHTQPEQLVVLGEDGHDEDPPSEDVEGQDGPRHAANVAPFASGQRAPHSRPPRSDSRHGSLTRLSSRQTSSVS